MILNLILNATTSKDSLANDSVVYMHHGNEGYTYFHTANWHFDWSVAEGLAIFIALLIAIACALTCFKKIRQWSLTGLFIIAWFLGFCVYDLGMCTGEIESLWGNAPMAFVHAFQMFLLESDVSAIHSAYHDNWRFMMCFSFAHAFAAWVSMLFVIKHFGFNLVSKAKLWLSSIFAGKCKNLYILWGVNEANFLLAEDIKRFHDKKIRAIKGDDTIEDKSTLLYNEKYRIIIVRTGIEDEDDENSNHKVGFDKIFDFLSLKTSEIDRMRRLNCLTCSTFKNIQNISVNTGERGTMDVLGGKLKLRSLRRIIRKTSPGKVHMIMLSDDEEANLHVVSVLSHDITLRDMAERKPSVCDLDDIIIFHCRARNNSIHKVIEDTNMRRGMMVKIVDTSHISVEMLKEEKVSLPAKYVDVENDASVSSAFNGLVIGFSEVGQDSVRFLYENAAFVKTGSHDGCVERSKFHLEVIDNKMDELAGIFLSGAPNLVEVVSSLSEDNKCSEEREEENKALISLKNMDCRSIEFYEYLSANIKDLNYIVVATEDDELNISMGVRIFKTALRYRENMEKFIILVRAQNDTDGRIRNIANHYNRLYKAHCAAIKEGEDKKKIKQNTVEANELFLTPIYIFGLDNDTYTFKNIIDEHHLKKAMYFRERYNASTEKNYIPKTDLSVCAWVKDIQKNLRLNDSDSHYAPTIDGLMNLRRTQGQDLANSMHVATKLYLTNIALGLLDMNHYNWENVYRDDVGKDDKKTAIYTKGDCGQLSDKVRNILRVLAQTEHLRWNASHELLGFTYSNGMDDANAINLGYKDEMKMEHGCILPWEKLNPKTQGYDYDVVDVTLGINTSKRRAQKK